MAPLPDSSAAINVNTDKSPQNFRYIGKHRRTKEDPRFVTGRGRYVADIALAGMKHVALVASPHPSARILSIKMDAALALRGVHYVLAGEEFCAATDALAIGVDAPKVARYSLAKDVVLGILGIYGRGHRNPRIRLRSSWKPMHKVG